MMPEFTIVPADIDAIDVAFPSRVDQLMPPMSRIPKEFKVSSPRGNKWLQFFCDAFYYGVKDMKLKPKEGIDQAKAMRHIKAVMGSFESKHEHKEAAVAYLMSLWFDDVTYTKGNAA